MDDTYTCVACRRAVTQEQEYDGGMVRLTPYVHRNGDATSGKTVCYHLGCYTRLIEFAPHLPRIPLPINR